MFLQRLRRSTEHVLKKHSVRKRKQAEDFTETTEKAEDAE